MYKIDKIFDAIIKINSNAKFAIRGDDINTCEIEWHNGTTPIPKADIEAKMAELPTEEEEKTAREKKEARTAEELKEFEKTNYARQRESAYPTVQELVVALYDTEDKAAIEAKRAEVKKKYPKP